MAKEAIHGGPLSGRSPVREEQQEMKPESPYGQSEEAGPSLMGRKGSMSARGPGQSWASRICHQRAAQGQSEWGSKFTTPPHPTLTPPSGVHRASWVVRVGVREPRAREHLSNLSRA